MKSFNYLLILIVLIFFASCKKEERPGTAQFNLRLTDSPGDYEEINIDFLEARVHISEGPGWMSLNSNAGIYDLLKLTNGTDTLIANAALPTGTISQLRLILGSNNTIKVDGQIYNLKTPSAEQSGLKLNIHQPLADNITYTILLDFDAARSIVETGNGEYILKPVIRAIAEAIDGGVKGSITPLAANPVVYAISGSDSVGTYPDNSGNFLIKGLNAGSYNIYFSPASGYQDTTVAGVSVTNGIITDMGIIPISQ
ncbi:MAG: DUF4382 domain-containing protein [Bacteroidia bacterium]